MSQPDSNKCQRSVNLVYIHISNTFLNCLIKCHHWFQTCIEWLQHSFETRLTTITTKSNMSQTVSTRLNTCQHACLAFLIILQTKSITHFNNIKKWSLANWTHVVQFQRHLHGQNKNWTCFKQFHPRQIKHRLCVSAVCHAKPVYKVTLSRKFGLQT